MILFSKWRGKTEIRTNKGFIKGKKFGDLILVESDDVLQIKFLKGVLGYKMYTGSMPEPKKSPTITAGRGIKSTPAPIAPTPAAPKEQKKKAVKKAVPKPPSKPSKKATTKKRTPKKSK